MKEFLVYTGLRLLLFLGSLAIVAGAWYLVDDAVPVLWAAIIALVVSGIASYFLLNGPREAFARRVEERASAAARAFEERKAKEDVD